MPNGAAEERQGCFEIQPRCLKSGLRGDHSPVGPTHVIAVNKQFVAIAIVFERIVRTLLSHADAQSFYLPSECMDASFLDGAPEQPVRRPCAQASFKNPFEGALLRYRLHRAAVRRSSWPHSMHQTWRGRRWEVLPCDPGGKYGHLPQHPV